MDVRKLLKVYNYVNNEKRPKVNYKFAGALVAFLAAGALLVGFLIAQNGGDDSEGSRNLAASCNPETTYVGIDPKDAGSISLSTPTADQEYAAWEAEHRDHKVTKKEPVTMGGVTLGYHVTSIPAKC